MIRAFLLGLRRKQNWDFLFAFHFPELLPELSILFYPLKHDLYLIFDTFKMVPVLKKMLLLICLDIIIVKNMMLSDLPKTYFDK